MHKVAAKASATIRALHDRMPVILPVEGFGPSLTGKDVRLGPPPDDFLAMHPVSLS